MFKFPTRGVALVVCLLVTLAPAWAQFGQNKVSYEAFDWKVYRSPHFDVHYYPAIEPFLEEIVSDAESAYLKISNDLDHELRFRVPLVVYKTHGEFQQTNITLSELPDGVAAFAEPVQYRMVLPIDQPPDMLYELIAHELVHIFQYSLFFDGYLGRTLRARPPTWLMEGMASYLAEDESNLDQMAIRDAVVNNILPPIQALNVLSFLTYRYGHAIFDYIEQEHGKEGMRSFLFEFKKVLLTGNLGRAIKEAFGYELDEFNRRFNRYLRRKYFPVLLEKKSPDEYGTELGTRRRGRFTFGPTLSPSGELIAALSTPSMELDLVVLSAEDGRKVKNLTKGWTNKYRKLVAEAFAGKRDVAWSPVADEIAVFARRENRWPLLLFDGLSGKLVEEIVMDDVFECASPAFSPDGRRIAFEGNRDGVVEILEIDLDTREVRNLTQDDYFDANPWYSADGQTLLYNRRIGSHWKIFSVDLSDASKKTQLTFGAYSDIQPSYSRDGNTIYFTSDRGPYGVFNIHSLSLETGNVKQYTDVVGGTFTPIEMAERDGERYLAFTAFFEGTFRLYRMPLRAPELEIEATERLSEPVEAEPFEPDLRLSVDEDKKAKYKIKWDIEAPSLTVGVADDGTFLASAGIQFTDLLGNHRINVTAATVSEFQQYSASYANFKQRYTWGGVAYDYRDYFVDQSTGQRIEREYAQTGVQAYIAYPFSRHFRIEGMVGLLDSAVNNPVVDGFTGEINFVNTDDRMGQIQAKLVGDTTRYQSFGPFQGKRFSVSAMFAPHISGDTEGDWIQYRGDFRAYKQATRRSLLAFRVAGIFNTGERTPSYGFGGLNQLRGYDYRDFFGSNIAWTNLEFRFPLVDELRFPILALTQIRGFFFLDVGAAWYEDNLFYDPELGDFRFEDTGSGFAPVGFKFWDSENDRLFDGRASYGVGFQFFFLGGLQFNWTWAQRLDHSAYLQVGPNIVDTDTIVKVDGGGTRTDFYITFDF
ncbi:MAG: hypothetical protein GY716_20355 [bacterium]|nr:hypothetical protein [bacterium]